MTPQSTFMICATVRDGQIKKLRTLLSTMNKNVGRVNPDNKLVTFCRFDRLHFARFTIIEAKTADEIEKFGVTPRPWQPSLAFLGDCDGDRDLFLAELVAHAEPGLTKIFSDLSCFTELPKVYKGYENDKETNGAPAQATC